MLSGRSRHASSSSRAGASVDQTAHAQRVESVADAAGRRIDEIERRVDRATSLARPGLDELELFPGRRIIRQFRDGTSSRAICSLALGPYVDLLGIAASTYAAYARRWGWHLVLTTEDLSDGRPAPWAKVPYVKELLDSYEWVLWMDADAAFVDLDADISAEQEPDKDLHVVEHHHGHEELVATAITGVFMLRSSRWSLELLDTIWAREDLIDHMWWENAALLELLGYTLAPARLSRPTALLSRVKFLDLAWNSVPSMPSPFPRINHHGAGLPIEQRKDRLLDDAATVRSGRPTSPAQ